MYVFNIGSVTSSKIVEDDINHEMCMYVVDDVCGGDAQMDERRGGSTSAIYVCLEELLFFTEYSVGSVVESLLRDEYGL